MNPFTEIALWAIVLMVVPFLGESLFLKRIVEKDMRLYFYITCGARRGANLVIFISLIYLIGNLLIPIIFLFLIEVLIGLLLYRKFVKDLAIKTLIINLFVANLISWMFVYFIFKFVFMNM